MNVVCQDRPAKKNRVKFFEQGHNIMIEVRAEPRQCRSRSGLKRRSSYIGTS